MPEPILPRDPADPQGTETLEGKAMRDYATRLKPCAQAYIEALERVPLTLVTNATSYQYRLDDALLQSLLANAGSVVDDVLLEGGPYAPWFFEQYVQVGMTRGIAQEVANLAAQSPAYKAARGNVLLSEPHLQRMILIRARVFEEMQSLSQDVKTDLSRLLTDGMGRGQNPLRIAKNLREQLGIEQFRADRIARTEIATAQRRAKWDEADDAEELYGSRSKEMHFSALSRTTRETHAARHGKLYTREEARNWWAEGANGINCYLPGTVVAGRFVAGSKARYVGPAVKIVTTSGRNLSVTPNHPVLTQRGWVFAHDVTERDNLFAHRVNIEHAVGVSDLNVDQIYTPIEQVYGSIAELGQPFTVGVHAVDFHGDGVGMDEDVRVVRADRELAFGVDPKLSQFLDGLNLKHADSVPLKTDGSFFESFSRVFTSPARGLRTLGALLTEIATELLVTKSCRVGPATPGEPELGETTVDLHARNTAFARQKHDALPGEVFGVQRSEVNPVIEDRPSDAVGLDDSMNRCAGNTASGANGDHAVTSEIFADDVVAVYNFEFSGHVYDLQERSGVMVANGLIASNCKCTSIALLVDKDGNPVSQGIIARARAVKEKMEKRGYDWSKE